MLEAYSSNLFKNLVTSKHPALHQTAQDPVRCSDHCCPPLAVSCWCSVLQHCIVASRPVCWSDVVEYTTSSSGYKHHCTHTHKVLNTNRSRILFSGNTIINIQKLKLHHMRPKVESRVHLYY